MGGGGLGKEKKETKAGLLLSRQTAGLRLGKVCNAQRYRLEKETDRQKNNKTKSKQTLKNETGGIKRTTNIFSLWDRQCRDRSGVTQSVRECGKPVPLVGKREYQEKKKQKKSKFDKGIIPRRSPIADDLRQSTAYRSEKLLEKRVQLFCSFALGWKKQLFIHKDDTLHDKIHILPFSYYFFSNSPDQPTGVDSVTSLQLPHTPQSTTIITTAIPLLVLYQNGDHA
ncbi:hypothetical protein T03_7038 [Trichinella britovi]|uniref:Uncharacterized protein n=1 Tax=Trichinella britovi TaxID=45882 RepID=A0A0V1CFQ6_TRIBR|nr:hypothetical protein T03_7038 [Trichinella britovi]